MESSVIEAMGCGSSTVASREVAYQGALPVPEEEEVGHKLTLCSWTMETLPGVNCTPNRAMHERHLLQMTRFMDRMRKADVVSWLCILEILVIKSMNKLKIGFFMFLLLPRI